jgi:uncharacterized protein involved in exopolysaccharide biosynthesis
VLPFHSLHSRSPLLHLPTTQAQPLLFTVMRTSREIPSKEKDRPMLQRALEIIFRSKLVILLPMLIVLPITVALALWPQRPQWRAISTVWVDPYKPLALDDRLGLTPALNQSALLQDFLHTHSFVKTVLDQSPLKAQIDDPRTADRAEQVFLRSVKVAPTSNAFFTITVNTEDPALTDAIARNINSTFQDMLQKRLQTQSDTAGKLYGDSLAQSQDALTKSEAQLAAYLAQRPDLASAAAGGGSGLPLSLRDGNLALLLQQVTADQQSYNTARQRFVDLQWSVATSEDAQPFAFTVVDPPQFPVAPVHTSRLLLLRLPAVGLTVGLMLGGAVAALLVLTNHTIMDSHDVQTYLGVPVIGSVSELGGGGWLASRRRRRSVRLQLASPANQPRSRAAAPPAMTASRPFAMKG